MRDRVSVAALVVCDRLASHLYSPRTVLLELPLSAAALACWPAFSLPSAPWCAGTQRIVTSFSLTWMRVNTSIAVAAKHYPSPTAFDRNRSIAEMESTNIV